MTPKDRKTNPFSQESYDLNAQIDPTLSNLNLPNRHGRVVLMHVIDVFQSDRLEAHETPASESEPSYSVLTRTLKNETFVQLRWGVSLDKTHTVADVEIDGGKGKSKLRIRLNQATNDCEVEYGTTVAGEGPSGEPARDAKLAIAFVTQAQKLLTKKDTSKAPEASIALTSLDAHRETRRKK